MCVIDAKNRVFRTKSKNFAPRGESGVRRANGKKYDHNSGLSQSAPRTLLRVSEVRTADSAPLEIVDTSGFCQ